MPVGSTGNAGPQRGIARIMPHRYSEYYALLISRSRLANKPFRGVLQEMIAHKAFGNAVRLLCAEKEFAGAKQALGLADLAESMARVRSPKGHVVYVLEEAIKVAAKLQDHDGDCPAIDSMNLVTITTPLEERQERVILEIRRKIHAVCALYHDRGILLERLLGLEKKYYHGYDIERLERQLVDPSSDSTVLA